MGSLKSIVVDVISQGRKRLTKDLILVFEEIGTRRIAIEGNALAMRSPNQDS
jgi:hypothetical protein